MGLVASAAVLGATSSSSRSKTAEEGGFGNFFGKPVSYICPQCNEGFGSMETAKKHIESKHPPARYECTFPGCTEDFKTADECRNHHTQKHSMQECGICVLIGKVPCTVPLGDLEKHTADHACHKHGCTAKEICLECLYPKKDFIEDGMINIAMWGMTSTGKSTLFNRLTGATRTTGQNESLDDAGKAVVTVEGHEVCFHDLKGLSANVVSANYVRDFSLRHMDALVMLIGNNICEVEINLLKELQKMKWAKAVVVAVGKADHLVSECETAEEAQEVVDSKIAEVKATISNKVGTKHMTVLPLFCGKPRLLDCFPDKKLADTLRGMFDNLKRHIIAKVIETRNLDTDGATCACCMENPPKMAFVPCGHLCVCQGCAGRLPGPPHMCPMCRTEAWILQLIYT
eukprot:TRINITY_DN4380_c1_g1_i7.p1 TRINITY_DN4380_c1_g1~~TRINITY_DN4380_c1_g1_i7.p1  ORF type:complete len:401 (+),score=83.14 TRINITY_DN4380_c1_g1_i7:751-1953(+)